MQEIQFLFGVAGLYLLLVVSPGPSFLVITTTAARQCRRQAVWAGLGVSCASVIWAAMAAAGLGMAMEHMQWLHRALQIAGGLYLLWIGVRTFWAASRPLPTVEPPTTQLNAWSAFRDGLLTNLTNPKTLVFFSSAFAMLFTPGLSVGIKLAAVLLVGLMSVVWHVMLATVFSAQRARSGYALAKKAIDRLTGGVMALFGLKLLLSRS
ncbi:threonine/homoserine/homoserine lactone efflux protein [Hydrogenophaga palleronii]|uniref:Threonine/homoserine/homoserine lactone efflux protein n=1 Tax=Hydrogenophaga palleronii TaxID=65655 RepID=A0ABU1WUS8_9BURK|nr:LysE family transporter [Hydrogenophaga palleronii]MDR7153043.1 threonine/homoserine/homoserine lactone efflux protein [Hydrogenophaga palleronii]